jgi:SAM-dependent methyltransferase
MDWADTSTSELGCRDCGQRYPVVCGIPDLRVFSDPYIDAESDRAKGLKVAEHSEGRDFEGLIDFYYSITEVVPPQHARRYKRGILSGVSRAESALASWEAASGAAKEGAALGKLLEIGCGTGPLLVAASRRFQQVVGIDIAFRWLVVGKKRLAEAGLDVPLICACAEALPFPDQSFDCVAADSVIEHTTSQVDSLKEARRVMGKGGRLFLSTPNRLSIGPDPHTGLPAGGMLPQKLTASYVRRLGGIPPKRQLLSVMSTNRLFKQCGFGRTRVFLPDVPEEQRALFPAVTQRFIDCYHVSKRLPISRHLLYLFGPLFYAVAEPVSENGSHESR